MKTPNLFVMSGLPRSGKSSIAEFLSREHGFLRVGSDDIREEYGMQWGSKDNREININRVVYYRAMEHLMMSQDVVIDTTGMFRQQRRLFFDLHVYGVGKLHRLKARKYIISVEIDDQIWLERQKAAGRSGDDWSFYRGKFQPVSADETTQLNGHFRFQNNTPADLEEIKRQLGIHLSRQAAEKKCIQDTHSPAFQPAS